MFYYNKKNVVVKDNHVWNNAGAYTVYLNIPCLVDNLQMHVYELLRSHPRINWILNGWKTSFTSFDQFQWFVRDVTIIAGSKCQMEIRNLRFENVQLPKLYDTNLKGMFLEGWKNLTKLNLAKGISPTISIRFCPHLVSISAETLLSLDKLIVWDCQQLTTLSSDLTKNVKEVDIGNCPSLTPTTFPNCNTLHYRPSLNQIRVCAPIAQKLILSLNRVSDPNNLIKTSDICPNASSVNVVGGGCIVGKSVKKLSVSFVEKIMFESPESIEILHVQYPDSATFSFDLIYQMKNLKQFHMYQSCYSLPTMLDTLQLMQHLSNIPNCEIRIFTNTTKLLFTKDSDKQFFVLSTPSTVWKATQLNSKFFNHVQRLFNIALQ